MVLKQKCSSFPRNLAFRTFGKLLIVFSAEVNLLYSAMSSVSDKAKIYAKNFSKNSNLDDPGISLPVFLSRTNLKSHNISITPKMVKKVITNLDSSKLFSPDCIPVVALKNCKLELSYILILAELFNMCLNESCFPDCWEVSSVVPVFKNVEKRSTAKVYC